MDVLAGGGDEFAEKYLCLVCTRVIDNAIQLMCCGLRLCGPCFSSTTTILCPNRRCRREVKENGYFLDKAFQRECKTKSVACDDGLCVWLGLVCEYQEHLDSWCISGDLHLVSNDEGRSASSIDSYSQTFRDFGDSIVSSSPVFGMEISQNLKHNNFCCSCGETIRLESIENHREKCYRLNKYKSICYSYIIEPSPAGASEVMAGTGDGSSFFMTELKYPIEYPDYGKICWKVSDLSRRLKDDDHQQVLSPSFYSAQKGYKLALKLDFCLREIQLLLLKGIHDDDLPFPFGAKVNLGVLSFGCSHGIYKSSITSHITRCFSEYGGSVVTSLSLPQLYDDGDLVLEDDVYVKCMVVK